MRKKLIPKEYQLKWEFKDYPEYKITADKKVINIITGKILKDTINGGYSRGFWIRRKFIPRKKINSMVQTIIIKQ